jgi:hypothetical protein
MPDFNENSSALAVAESGEVARATDELDEITPEPWVSTAQVAAHVGFSADWVRDKFEDGTLRSAGISAGRKKGARLRFKLSLVDAALRRLAEERREAAAA